MKFYNIPWCTKNGEKQKMWSCRLRNGHWLELIFDRQEKQVIIYVDPTRHSESITTCVEESGWLNYEPLIVDCLIYDIWERYQ